MPPRNPLDLYRKTDDLATKVDEGYREVRALMERADRILGQAQEAIARIESISARVEGTLAQAERSITEASRMTETLRPVLQLVDRTPLLRRSLAAADSLLPWSLALAGLLLAASGLLLLLTPAPLQILDGAANGALEAVSRAAGGSGPLATLNLAGNALLVAVADLLAAAGCFAARALLLRKGKSPGGDPKGP
jgi:hypothetical protein